MAEITRVGADLLPPYRLQGKGGKNDAAPICEAANRPQMHFALIKSIEQQTMLRIHRLREGFKQERTACTMQYRFHCVLILTRARWFKRVRRLLCFMHSLGWARSLTLGPNRVT